MRIRSSFAKKGGEEGELDSPRGLGRAVKVVI
mgnify:CR=1 FL=1